MKIPFFNVYYENDGGLSFYKILDGDKVYLKGRFDPFESKYYFSKLLGENFVTLEEYWRERGAREAEIKARKVTSVSLDQLINSYIRTECLHGSYVVLYDIDTLLASNSDYFRKIPDQYKSEFMNDVVILNCKDIHQADTLFDSLPENFSRAKLVSYGMVIRSTDCNWAEDSKTVT